MRVSPWNRWNLSKTTVAVAAVAAAGVLGAAAYAASPPTLPGTLRSVGSTVPKNGDVNPYGMALVQRSTGRLVVGDVLVSNFNNAKNLQGTGTTIVEVSPAGSKALFATIDARSLPGACPGGVGLTTALSVFASGWVVVGSLPSNTGKAANAKAGCLLVLDSNGKVVETWSGHGINGPWDMTATEHGSTAALFVTNVLNGTVAAKGSIAREGTVVRLDLSLRSGKPPLLTKSTVVGSGFPERTDPGALVVGPTGVGVGSAGQLYVADTAANKINVIAHATTRNNSAGEGTTLTAGAALNNPLGLFVAPSGAVLTVNAGDGRLVVTNPAGKQTAAAMLDASGKPKGAGALFGLILARNGLLFFVDDATNTLDSFSSSKLRALASR
ncbi:MAG: NHL repeat-containing protein [Casimicrobiaceae bacterium]